MSVTRENWPTRVLVVEDDPLQRMLATALLRRLGIDCDEAGDGREALTLMRGRPPYQIVFSDLDMPEMDGIEFLRHVAAEGLADAVTITSGLDRAMTDAVTTMAAAYGIRVLDNIPKPLTHDRLVGVLNSYAEKAVLPGGMAAAALPSPDALRQDLEDGAFTPYYQPTVDLATGDVVSVETLTRHLPLGGNAMRPATFIPALEQAGLLSGLTHRNLERASAANVAWHAIGLELSVAVNVSLTELVTVEVADEWADVVHQAGAVPASVTFEITETSVMEDLAVALDVLTRLRLMGFGLSIDDFGTGHSSLDQLRTIPFSELKIDRAFVAGATRDKRRRMMLENTLLLTERLGLRSVAEGVETREEWDLVLDLGCDVAQGWYISDALPSGAVPDWVATWRGTPH